MDFGSLGRDAIIFVVVPSVLEFLAMVVWAYSSLRNRKRLKALFLFLTGIFVLLMAAFVLIITH